MLRVYEKLKTMLCIMLHSMALYGLFVCFLVWHCADANAQDVSDPEVPEQRVFILQDMVDDFNFGLNAGGELRGFGNVLGEFSIREGEGIYSGTTANGSIDSAAILATVPNGFGGEVGQDFIGFSKTFALSTDPVTGETSNAIGARGFSGISYFVKNDGDNSASITTVAVELVVGDGGDITPNNPNDNFTGSTWTQTQPVALKDIAGDTAFNNYQRIVVNLEGSFEGVPNGFKRTTGPSEGSTQTTLTEELLQQVTAVNIVMLSNTDINERRAIFVDNIVFVSSSFNLSVRSSPVIGVPISGDFNGATAFEIPSLADEVEVTLCTPIFFQDGAEQLIFDRWLLDGVSRHGSVDLGGGVNCITFKLIQNSTLIAAYKSFNHTLNVRSEDIQSMPILGIPIEGTPAGTTTDIVMVLEEGLDVSLAAPIIHNANGQRFHFLHWEIDDETQALRQNVVRFTIGGDVDATAVYEAGDFALTVSSVPVSGVTINGTNGGTTDYVVILENGSQVGLTAPTSHQLLGTGLDFKKWLLLGEGTEESEVLSESLPSDITISRDTNAVAVFDVVWVLNAGWNLISSPVELATITQNELRSRIESPLWFWNGKEFEATDAIEVGKGYWVFTDEDELPIELVEATPANGNNTDTTIPLNLGWNLFGLKELNIIIDPVNSTVFTTPPNTNSMFWTWDVSRQIRIPISDTQLPVYRKNTLFPGLGYWVYVTQQHLP